MKSFHFMSLIFRDIPCAGELQQCFWILSRLSHLKPSASKGNLHDAKTVAWPMWSVPKAKQSRWERFHKKESFVIIEHRYYVVRYEHGKRCPLIHYLWAPFRCSRCVASLKTTSQPIPKATKFLHRSESVSRGEKRISKQKKTDSILGISG